MLKDLPFVASQITPAGERGRQGISKKAGQQVSGPAGEVSHRERPARRKVLGCGARDGDGTGREKAREGRPAGRPQKLCRHLAQTYRPFPFGQECDHPVAGNAYPPVFFEGAFGSLHLDIFVGGELSAEPVGGGGASFKVFAESSIVGSLQVPANWTLHLYTFPAFCQSNHGVDAVAVQKAPGIPMEVLCWRRSECSPVKSSKNASWLARGDSGLISEEWALPARGLRECRLLLRVAERRALAWRFLWRIIAAPWVGGGIYG